jgi:hypothetical protein
MIDNRCPKLKDCHRFKKCEKKCKNMQATCNISVKEVFRSLTENTAIIHFIHGTEGHTTANDIYDILVRGVDCFVEVKIDKVQDLANLGHIVIGASKADKGSGHVVIVAPEDTYTTQKDGKKAIDRSWYANGYDEKNPKVPAPISTRLPLVMDTGSGKRAERMLITGSYGKGDHHKVKFLSISGQNNNKAKLLLKPYKTRMVIL